MANTKIPVELSSTPGIVDNSNATAITIDSSERVGIGETSPSAPLTVNTGSDGNNVYIDNNGTQLAIGSTSSVNYINSQNGSAALAIQTNGTERMRIDSSGNVSIGTTSTTAPLRVKVATDANFAVQNTSSTVQLQGINDAANAFTTIDIAGNPIKFSANGSESMRIDSSGNVGIGETNPTKLGLTGSSTGKVLALGGDDCQLRLTYTVLHHDHSGNTTTHLRNHYGSLDALARMKLESGYITFHTGTAFTERVRINSSGTLLIGTSVGGSTSTGISLNSNGTGAMACNFTSANEIFTYNNNNATGTSYEIDFRQNNAEVGKIAVGSSSTAYQTSSDYRLKENVQPLENGLDRVKKLNPVQFDWKESGETSEGFLAHEIQEAGWYEGVSGVKDGEDMQSMDYGRITPLLVKAIQEQQAQIEALQSEINELKNS